MLRTKCVQENHFSSAFQNATKKPLHVKSQIFEFYISWRGLFKQLCYEDYNSWVLPHKIFVKSLLGGKGMTWSGVSIKVITAVLGQALATHSCTLHFIWRSKVLMTKYLLFEKDPKNRYIQNNMSLKTIFQWREEQTKNKLQELGGIY